MWVATGVVASLALIVSQAMISAMRALYSRGDFDLLFASPVSPYVVLGSRALAVAFEGVAFGALIVLPVANMGALLGRPHWLVLYPVLLSAALGGAGVGLILAMASFVALGPRRGRVFLQVVATLVGASFVLTAQAVALFSPSVRAALIEAFADPAPGTWLDHGGLLWLPVRAALGEPVAVVLWFVICAAIFVGAVVMCGGNIVDVAAIAANASSTPGRGRHERAFGRGIGAALRAKELKLIRRDPWLLSQVLLQVIYALPVGVVLWRGGGATGSAGVAFAPSIVLIAAQLSGSLTWVAISGEDAPELLATAPVTRSELERRKLEAIALPIAAVLAFPILGLALASPWGAACATLFALGAGASTALLNLWWQAPSRRSMVLRRHSQSRLFSLVEILMTMLWAVACASAILRSWLAPALLGVVALVLWMSRPRGPAFRRRAAAEGLG